MPGTYRWNSCVPPFQLVKPPDINQVNPIPKRNLEKTFDKKEKSVHSSPFHILYKLANLSFDRILFGRSHS